MYKIIVTGPESSGKTTLSKQLSNQLNLPLVSEYSREYLNHINRQYIQSDLLKIAKHQYNNEQKYNQSIICDTDLITIKIWSEYKYSHCHKWILKKIDEQNKSDRIYLLCKPDIEWEYDPLRENPKNREDLFNLYIKELQNNKMNYFLVKGENRFLNAYNKLNKVIKKI